MNATRLARGLTAAAALCAAGCSAIYSGYEGQTDYAKADLRGAADKPLLPLVKKYGPTDPDGEPIQKDARVSVHLTSAFIKQFHEGWEGWWNPFVQMRGEIAIVARCFELTGSGIDFDPAATRSGGRVIFYTEDARQGQYLNFSNLPIYGPEVYGGHPLAIELSVIELDEAEGAKAKQLLSKMAEIGSAAYASASPAIALLDQLGGSLLAGNRDDMEMKYVFVLDPTESTLGWRHPALEANHYALVRRDVVRSVESKLSMNVLGSDNVAPTDWTGLFYDQELGRLADATGAPYQDSSYLIVRVDTGMSALEPGDVHTLDSLQTSLKKQAETAGFLSGLSAKDLIEKVIAPFQAKALDGVRQRGLADAIDLIGRLRRLKKGGLPSAGDKAKFVDTLRALYERLDAAAKSIAATPNTPNLTEDQFKRILADLEFLVLDAKRPDWANVKTSAEFGSSFAVFAAFRAFFIAN